MKKILLLAAFMLSLAPAKAELLTGEKATSYSKVVDGWTYITNAAEFMLLVSECQSPDVGEKKIKLACDIEYPSSGFYKDMSMYYIKYFNGVFDGMGCSIKFYINANTNENADIAFIQELKGTKSEVCNLRFTDCCVKSAGSTAAVVVNKVTATEETSIHDIYVDGGELNGSSGVTAMGGLVRLINENTTIEHCAVRGLTIRWIGTMGAVSTPVGIFGDELPAGADDHTCIVTNCYMASTPGNISTVVKFSCLTNYKDLHSGELTQKLKRNKNCFYSDDCNFSGASADYFEKLENIESSELVSGDDKLKDEYGWVYKEGQVPLPAGLFYWNPNNNISAVVGTHSSSETLTGRIEPLDYGRYIDITPLKLTRITNVGSSTSYAINDNITNEIGVKNPITALDVNVFYNIPMTTLKLPGLVTTIEGSAFRHGVTEGFISNGNWRYEGNLLYLNTGNIKRLITAVGDNEELTINGRYCTEIADEAFLSQENLTHLYINTWFPANATSYPPIALLGNKVFTEECYNSKLEVYVKDGTQGQLIIGEDIEHGYKYFGGSWKMFFFENQDRPNRLFQYFPVTRNPAGLSTLVLGYPVKLPSDCRAWIATGIDGDKLVLKRVKGNIVPAELPVLLSYEKKEGTMHLTPYEGTDAPASTQYDPENLLFRGSIDPAEQTTNPSEMQSNVLTLQLHPSYPSSWDKVGFYRFTGYVLPSNVAWIPMSLVPSNAHLAMFFDGDYEFTNPTGVNDVADQEDNVSAPVYNLSGQRVGNNYRGMVIKNGRKYITK